MAAGCVATSCASTTPSVGGDRNLIIQDEIETVTAGTAWDLVQLLRPEFLQLRAMTSMQTVQQDERIVFLDGQRMGGINTLRQIPTSLGIVSIRLLSPPEAAERWGDGLRSGAIEVRTDLAAARRRGG